jgi:hypothetical protein
VPTQWPRAEWPRQHFLLYKFGVNVAVDEFRAVEHLQVEFNSGGNSRDGTFIQGPFHPGHGVLPVFAPNNHLSNQRVVEGGDVVPRIHVAIDTHPRARQGVTSR